MFSMIVIGRIKSITTLIATDKLNPFNLKINDKYHM